MGEVVYLSQYVPNMGAILKLAILNLSQFFYMERGSCDISNNISIFCQVHSCKQIRSSSYGSKVSTHLNMEERIEVILMSGKRSFRVMAADFSRKTSNFTQHCQVLHFQIPRNWDCVWQGTEWPSKKCYWWGTLSATVSVSRNVEIKHLAVLCEIGSLSGCRLLKFAGMTPKLRTPDIKMNSILSSVVKAIFSYLEQSVL